jgi:Fe-S cluster biogenesis protein NfuA
MGIRQALNAMKDRDGGGPGRKPLALSEAAREAVRARIDEGGDPDVVFFVLTQPSALGFDVGVGFERKGTDPARHLRPEFDVPVAVSDEDHRRLGGFTIDFRDGHFVTHTDVTVHVSETPNPESRKFILNQDLVTEGSATFNRPVADDAPPLVRVLMDVPGVRSLFFIRNFCSVTREPDADWQDLQMDVGKRLQGYFAHGGAPMAPPPSDDGEHGEIERKIIEVIEDVVRPAVQQDGGDIVFAGYDEGTVQLYMLGSCVGCPSSTATLKMGVENLLKEAVPEVTEVVSIE